MVSESAHYHVNMTVVCSCSPSRQFSAGGPANRTPPCPKCNNKTIRVKEITAGIESKYVEDDPKLLNLLDAFEEFAEGKGTSNKTKRRERRAQSFHKKSNDW